MPQIFASTAAQAFVSQLAPLIAGESVYSDRCPLVAIQLEEVGQTLPHFSASDARYLVKPHGQRQQLLHWRYPDRALVMPLMSHFGQVPIHGKRFWVAEGPNLRLNIWKVRFRHK